MAAVLTAVTLTYVALLLEEPSASVTPFGCRSDNTTYSMGGHSEEDLIAWFNQIDANKAVDTEHIQDFLDAAADLNYMAPMAADGKAQAIIDNGYTSSHSLCELTADDLRGMGFLNAHAKKLATYLGEPIAAAAARQQHPRRRCR